MTSKISMLQRQMAFQRDGINNEHKLVKVCKEHIKWLKGVPDIASTKKRIDGLYKIVEGCRKRISKLAEMQKFTKGQLQEAYNEELADVFQCYVIKWPCSVEYPAVLGADGAIHEWESPVTSFKLTGFDAGNYGGMTDHKCYEAPGGLRNEYKHNPKFMGETPAAEVGSFVGDEL